MPLADGAADKLVGLKMAPSSDGVISVGETVLQENLFYHIRDEFYNLVQDDNLQSNKDNGGYRPHYYALRDTTNEDIFWMVPVSSRFPKYKSIRNSIIERYGKCTTIVLGQCGSVPAAFLIQNAFPVIERYIDHVHTINEIPVKLHKGTAKLVTRCLIDNLRLHRNGVNLFFTDIDMIYDMMKAEISKVTE